MTVEFGVLGSIEADIDGRSTTLGHARQRGVLAVLLADVNRPVTTDQLVDRIWGDSAPRQAVTTLRGYLSRLRQALAATSEVAIARQPGGYVLNVADTVTVDMHTFRLLLTRARATADDTRAAALFEQALRLWRSEPFATLDTPWLNALRDTLVQEQQAAQLDLGDLRLRLGQHAVLLPGLSARAAARPLDERLAVQLILALHRSGRSAEALDHFHRTRGRLGRELGIDPGQALRDAQSAVLSRGTAPTTTPRQAESAQPITPPAQLPLSVAAFTGREDELARLDTLLPGTGRSEASPARPAAVVVLAMSGTAGVGKTALAVHWAHRVRDSFPDGQLYVNLHGFDPGGSVMSPADAVQGFLDAFGVPPARIPQGLEAQTGLYRSLLTGRRVLVVLDNARDAEQVRPLLPGAPGCLALVTSRDRLTGLAATAGAQLLTVDLLTPAEARDLITGRLGAHRTAAEPAAVDEIVARCAGLPLALAITAARAAARPRLPLTALAQELQESGGRLDALDGGDPATRIRAVFATSYQALSGDSARLFRLLGLHPGPGFTVSVAASLAGLPRTRTRALLTELSRAGLLTDHAPGRHTFHDLLRAYAAELVTTHDSDDTRRSAVHRMLDHYLHTAHTADALLSRKEDPLRPPAAAPGAVVEELPDPGEALAWFTAEHPVVLAAVEQAPSGFETHTWQLAAFLATFLIRQGRWSALAAAHTTALNAARCHHDRAGLAYAHRGLAFAHTKLNRPDEARTHYALALDLFRELGDHAGQTRIHSQLAELSSDLGEHRSDEGEFRSDDGGEHQPDAERLKELNEARQILAHYQAAHNRLGQAIALNHIGRILAGLDDQWPSALSHSWRALALVEEIGDLHGQVCTWRSLGHIHRRLSRYERAVDCYGQAVVVVRGTDDRYHEAACLTDLGDTHAAAGHPDAAHDAWTQALALVDGIPLPDTAPLRVRLRHNLDRRTA
ncbi:BTAD domain-containing putative transcriptional regulator [Streptomyces sp. NPDC059466]|uniref:AfsR/SARP family transcriptional regulator n=1 Tax=unclassified Streptomyces TaxID=2593676 RepID=UPI003685A6DF